MAEPADQADRVRHPAFARHQVVADGSGSLFLPFGKRERTDIYYEVKMIIRLTVAIALALLTEFVLPAFAVAQLPVEGQEQKFAKALSRAIQIIADGHAKPIPQTQLAIWAIEGLYDEVKKPVPAELAQRLEKLEQAKVVDLRQLLQDASATLLAGRDEGSQRAVEMCVSAIFRRLEPGARAEDGSGLVRGYADCIYRTDSVGIGLKVQTDPDSGMLLVVTPIFNGPAHKAGVRAGDLITHIRIRTDLDGNPLAQPKEFSTKGMTPERAQDLFLGQSGSALTLKVVRAK